MPTIPPNNNTGLYGIDGSSVAISNDVTVDNLAATGNITAGGNLAVGNNATVGGNLTVGGTIYGDLVGNIVGNLVVPGANTQVLFNSDGNAGASADFTFNDNTNVLDVNGNVVANYFIGDGSQLTGLPASYGNANVADFLDSLGSNAIVTTGNITGGYFIGNGSQLTGLPASYGNSNVVTLLAAYGSNTISTTGNITGGYIFGNGSQLTGLPATYGNSNVAAYLPTYTGNLAGGNLAVTNNSTVGGNLTVGGTIYGTFSGNISGNLVVPGSNTQVIYNNNGNAGANPGFTFNSGANVMTVVGSANVSVLNAAGNVNGGNLVTTGQVTASGNVTGANIIGNGQFLTNLPGGNVTGQVANALVAGTVYTAAQPAITSVGTLTGLTVGGDSNITGNLVVGQDLTVNGNTIYTNITELNVQDPIISQGRGANNTPLTTNDGKDRGEQFWYYSGSEKSAFSGYDNSAGKMLLATDVSIANEIVTVNSLGNIVGGNIEATSVVTSGNVTASYVIGNGSTLSSLTGANVTGTVPLATSATTAGTVTTAAQPNITSVGTLSSLSVTGNITGGNVNSTFFGSGAGLSSLTGANVTGTVANATYATSAGSATTATTATSATTAGTVTTAAQPNITSVGTLSSLSVTNNIYGGTANINGSLAANIITAASSITATSGNITAGGYFIGNGSQLTGLPVTYGNSNVSAYLASGTNTANIITTGNIQGGNLKTDGISGNISGVNYVFTNTVTANNAITVGAVRYTATDGIAGQVLTTYGNGTTYFATPSGGSYGDSNVVTLMSSFGSNTISTTGNISGGNIIGTHIGSGAALSSLTGANVTGIVANATYATSAGSATTATTATSATTAGTVTTAAQPNITSVGTLSSLSVSGNITTGGILTDGYYYANGTPFTGGGGSTYGNSNVNTLLAAWGSNTLSTTGTVSAGNITGANLITSGNIYGNTAKIYTDVNGFAAYGSQNPSSGGYVTNGAGNILIGGHPTLGVLLMTKYNEVGQRAMSWDQGNLNLNPLGAGGGNIYGAYDIVAGNAILSTGNIFTYGTFSGATVGAVGNITGGNLVTAGQVSATGNITGGNLISGSLTYTPTDGTAGQVLTTYGNGKTYFSTVSGGSYGDSNVNTLLASWGSNTLSTTGNVTAGNMILSGQIYDTSGVLQLNGSGNIVLVPVSSTQIYGNTNIIGGKLTADAVTYANTDGTAGQVLTTYGNGQTYFSTVSGGSGSPGGANTQLQFNDAGSFAGNAAMTFDNTTGNISFGNLVIGNIGSSGTFYNVITNKNPLLGNSSTMPSNARILMGSGKSGDWSTTADIGSNGRNSRLAVADEYIKTDNGVRIAEIYAAGYANLNGSTTYGSANSNSRIQGIVSDLYVYGGNIVATSPFDVRSVSVGTSVGTGANVGNANISGLVGTSSYITVYPGSVAGNTFSVLAGTTNTGVTNTQIAYGIALGGNANSTGNAIGIYNPSNTSVFGITNGNSARGAANYYFIRNDDLLAKNQIGQMNRYFDGFANCGGSVSGAVTVNANNGQMQYLNITENVTSMTFSNFVNLTSAPSGSPLTLADTVTLIITQDSTGRTITMPTTSGSNIYKYAGGINTISSTANSVTMVSITGVIDSSANNVYLITISPEFS